MPFIVMLLFPTLRAHTLTLRQLVMFSTQSQAHCRHSSHRPSSWSLGILIMPLCPLPCLHSHNIFPATPETINTGLMPTAWKHTTHPPLALARSDHNLVHLLPVYKALFGAFRSGNKEELKAVQKELRKNIQGKNSYKRKMEDQLQQRSVNGVQKCLKPSQSRDPAPKLHLCLCVNLCERGEISLWRWYASGGSIRGAFLANRTSVNE